MAIILFMIKFSTTCSGVFHKSFFTLALCLFALSILPACTTNPATGKRQFTAFMSPQKELQIGASEHEKIKTRFGLYDDPALVAYVNEIGRKVTANTERPDVKFQFFILDSPIVNAFALPGGFIYVSRGLMALANNEAELAAVLAHEAGHITGRHSAERYSHAVVSSLGAAVLSAAVDSSGVSDALGLGSDLYLSSYSRGQESEADTLGLRYMSRSGYDTASMSSFLSALQRNSDFDAKKNDQEQAGFSYFSTHPATSDRVAKTRAQSSVYPSGGKINQSKYFSKIDGMVYGDNTSQGFVKGQSFFHPELGFTFDFPKGYRLINQPDQIVISRRDGPLAIFDLAPLQTGMSPFAYLQNVWMKSEKLSGLESITVNGFSGAAASFQGRVNGKLVTIRLIAVAWKPNQVARFQIAIPRGTSGAEIEKLKRVTYSFHALGDDKPEITPHILAIRNSSSVADIRRLVDSQPFDQLNEDLFLMLNGVNAISAAQAGRDYKFVFGE